MKTIYTILIALATVLSCQFSKGQTLDPKLIVDSLYCFDNLQVRFIAMEVNNSPIKDTIIDSLETRLNILDSRIAVKDSIIKINSIVRVNDSTVIANNERSKSITKDLNDIELDEEKDKRKWWQGFYLLPIVRQIVIYSLTPK